MSEDVATGEALVRRYMDREHEAIFARGDFSSLFSAWLDHVRLWDSEPDGLSSIMMRQALGGAALYLSSRPRDESIAFTLNIDKPPMNVFVTGSSKSCTVTGRVFTENVATTGGSRLFVQSTREAGRDFTSVIDVEGVDVLLIFEQFCSRSDQTAARFFEITDDEFLMVASLPIDEGQEWIGSLDRESALARLDSLRLLDERRFWFQCGCNPEKIFRTMRRMFAGRPEELFQGDDGVNVSCPRCGREWRMAAGDF